MRYTDEQEKILDSDAKTILVRASAGTGKTFVMIEKIARLLREGVPIEKMLVITFTEKAATEMRERLAAKCEASDDPLLLRAKRSLMSADISTLHAYAGKMVRRYAYLLGTAPDRAVLLPSDAELMAARAMEETLRMYYRDRHAVKLLRALGASEKRLTDLIVSMDRFLWEGGDPKVLIPYPDGASLRAALVDAAKEELANAVADYDELILLIPDGPRLVQMEAERAMLAEFSRTVGTTDEVRPDFQRAKPVKDKELAKILTDKRNAIKKAVDEIAIPDEETLTAELEAKRFVLAEATGLARDFRTRYQAAKRAANGMDFDDMEHDFLTLLEDARAHDAITGMKTHVFFDEYQDANPIQEKILQAFASAKLFLVGDVKQSIYVFRGSEPALFLAREAAIGAGKTPGEVFSLTKNFRSEPDILRFVNTIFEHAMTPETGGIDYTKGHAFAVEGTGGTIEARTLDTKLRNEERVRARAIRAAKTVLREHADTPFEDMAILMRTNDFYSYARVFDTYGIPYRFEHEETDYASGEPTLYHLLNHFVHPREPMSLAVALRSFAGGCDENDLYRIAASGEDFVSAYETYDRDDETMERIRAFRAFTERWKKQMAEETLTRFVRDFIYESGYLESLSETGTPRTLRAVTAFADEAAAFDAKTDTGIVGFLMETRERLDRGMKTTTSIATDSSDDAVTFLTMHKSKGLEFPVVILEYLGKNYNLRDAAPDKLILSRVGSSVPIYVDGERVDDPARLLFSEAMKDRQRAEEARLFYVAATRAKEKLILHLEGEGKGKSTPNAMQDLYFAAAEYVDVPITDALENEELPEAIERKTVVRTPRERIVLPEMHTTKKTTVTKETHGMTVHFDTLEEEDRSAALELGTRLHRIVEKMPRDLREMDAYLAEADPDGLFTPAMQEAYRRVIAPLLEGAQVHHEYAFTMRREEGMETVHIDGQIDLLIERDDACTVIDFKSDRTMDKTRYEAQLALYAEAVAAAYGKPTTAAVYWLRFGALTSYGEMGINV